jgi:L-threonylcarbamoyladenylate synthase
MAAVRRLRIHEPTALRTVLDVMRRPGSLVVLPTETLYGFSAPALDAASIARVTALKGRREAGFVALAADLRQVQPFLAPTTPPQVLDWLRSTWPAALSAILPVTGPLSWGRGSVDSSWTAAFRVPRHAWMRQLAESLGEPILSTSVNRTGAPPLRRATDIVAQFGDRLDLVVQDAALEDAPVAAASTLVDATRWPLRVVRQGAFSVQLEDPGEA